MVAVTAVTWKRDWAGGFASKSISTGRCLRLLRVSLDLLMIPQITCRNMNERQTRWEREKGLFKLISEAAYHHLCCTLLSHTDQLWYVLGRNYIEAWVSRSKGHWRDLRSWLTQSALWPPVILIPPTCKIHLLSPSLPQISSNHRVRSKSRSLHQYQI